MDAGDFQKAKQMAGRSIHVTEEMTEDAKKLIRLMGCPVIEAPGEAEAQCAQMSNMVTHTMGPAYGTASEDMDALTFGSTFLFRGFNNSKYPITQIELS